MILAPRPKTGSEGPVFHRLGKPPPALPFTAALLSSVVLAGNFVQIENSRAAVRGDKASSCCSEERHATASRICGEGEAKARAIWPHSPQVRTSAGAGAPCEPFNAKLRRLPCRVSFHMRGFARCFSFAAAREPVPARHKPCRLCPQGRGAAGGLRQQPSRDHARLQGRGITTL